jgi:hypothetical protein
MSRWLSRTVLASARRGGRAERAERAGRAAVAVRVAVSCACAVMMFPGFPRCHSSLGCLTCPVEHGM